MKQPLSNTSKRDQQCNNSTVHYYSSKDPRRRHQVFSVSIYLVYTAAEEQRCLPTILGRQPSLWLTALLYSLLHSSHALTKDFGFFSLCRSDSKWGETSSRLLAAARPMEPAHAKARPGIYLHRGDSDTAMHTSAQKSPASDSPLNLCRGVRFQSIEENDFKKKRKQRTYLVIVPIRGTRTKL